MILAGGAEVLTVTASKTVHVAPVKLGRDFGTQIEITGGLETGTLVVANPNDSMAEGMAVEPVLPTPAKKS